MLDVMLPGRSGIEFLDRAPLRRRAPGDPGGRCVSAWQSDDDAKAAYGAGADAFVGKPFDPEDLATLVEGLIAA